MNKSDFFTELEDGINILKELIKKYKKSENTEIELRIGQIQDNSFIAGLNSSDFYEKILEKLNSCTEFKKIKNTTEDIISDKYRKTITFNNKRVSKQTVMYKNTIEKHNLTYTGTPYDIRISVAREIIVDDVKVQKTADSIIRKKERNSFIYKSDYRIDITKVTTTQNTVENVTYELEVELLNLKSNISDVYRAHSALLLLRDAINFCEEISEDSKLESAD